MDVNSSETLLRQEHTGSVLASTPLNDEGMASANHAHRLLSALFCMPGTNGNIGIWDLGSKRNRWFATTADGIREAVQYAKAVGTDVYFHCCTHDPEKVRYRGTNASAKSLVSLWADIDTAEAAKANGKHYPPRETVLEILRDLPFRPSGTIHSGRGVHAYWLLRSPADAQLHRDVPAAFLRYLNTQMVDKSTGEAFDLDPVCDLARLLRVPGTTNSKAPLGDNRVRIIALNENRRYDIDDFSPYLFAEGQTPGVAHSDIRITLDPDAKAPSDKLATLRCNAAFSSAWTGAKHYDSPSEAGLALAGYAARAGFTDQEIADLLVQHRRERGIELKLKNVQKYARTIAKAKAELSQCALDHETILKELNSRHAVVPIGGRTVILNEQLDPDRNYTAVSLSDPKDLRLLYSNRTVPTPHGKGKPISFADFWLTHPRRRQYGGVVFSPSRGVEGFYNLFRGFGVEAISGDCSLFTAHIRDVICGGDLKVYEYVMGWCAHLFQKPAELPGVAIVLRGKQGTGKNVFVDALGKLVGQHYMPLTSMNQVTGRFNSHMKDALLVFANEAIWGGDKAAEGALKAMITDTETVVECKGKDIFRVRNYKRLIMASNEQWAAPVGLDDRRYLVIDVLDTHKEDHGYFKVIDEQMRHGGYEALAYLLMSRDLSNFNPRQRPHTGAGLDMKLRGHRVAEFWFHCLRDGEIPSYEQDGSPIVMDTEPTIVPKETLRLAYGSYSHQQGFRHSESPEQFTKELKRVCRVATKKVPHEHGRRMSSNCVPLQKVLQEPSRRVPSYRIPPLKDCRDFFERALNAPDIDWDEGAEIP